jgi:hypothetical protein
MRQVIILNAADRSRRGWTLVGSMASQQWRVPEHGECKSTTGEYPSMTSPRHVSPRSGSPSELSRSPSTRALSGSLSRLSRSPSAWALLF